MSNLDEKYSFPVWGTQGGGLVKQSGQRYVFVEAPDPCFNLQVGDLMPEEWGLASANQLARREMDPLPEGLEFIDDLSEPELDTLIKKLEGELGLEPMERT